MKKSLVLLVLGLLALVAAACGDSGDGDDNGGSASDTSEESSSDEGGGGDSDSEFCELARKFSEEFEDSAAASNQEDQATQFKELRAAIEQLEDEAPDEIEDDVKTVADAFRESDDLLKKYDYDFSKVPEAEAENVSINSAEVTAASNRVESYFEKTCKIDSDGDGDTDGEIETTDPTAGDDSGTSGEEQAPDDTTETTAEG